MHDDTTATANDDTGIAVIGSERVRRLLAKAGYAIIDLPSEKNVSRGSGVAPRLALFEHESEHTSAALDHVRAIQKAWPLVDILVLHPGASGASVRGWLRAGVRDVLLDADDDDLLRRIKEMFDAQRILPLVDQLAKRRIRTSRFEGMLSRSHAMWDVFEICARVAPTDANVLICGETGTGKELLARALHRRSSRKGRFAAVNCSALPEQLIDSELFGHEQGAFTGATSASQGIFRAAEGGTVFLDEIGDMPPAAQQRLLRVLEERKIRPIGGTSEIEIDVRIVAATHVELERAVMAGEFREDLFYRLDVIRLQIPPLRERPEDIVYLFGHFVKSFAKHYAVDRPRMTDGFLERLARHDWPGNVRELENFAERVVLRRTKSLDVANFDRLVRPAALDSSDAAGAELESSSGRVADVPEPDITLGLEEALQPVVADFERSYLERLLEETQGQMQVAADRAGISRRTLQRKLKAHAIDKNRFKPS